MTTRSRRLDPHPRRCAAATRPSWGDGRSEAPRGRRREQARSRRCRGSPASEVWRSRTPAYIPALAPGSCLPFLGESRTRHPKVLVAGTPGCLRRVTRAFTTASFLNRPASSGPTGNDASARTEGVRHMRARDRPVFHELPRCFRTASSASAFWPSSVACNVAASAPTRAHRRVFSIRPASQSKCRARVTALRKRGR